jgi:hypothetical protein
MKKMNLEDNYAMYNKKTMILDLIFFDMSWVDLAAIC